MTETQTRKRLRYRSIDGDSFYENNFFKKEKRKRHLHCFQQIDFRQLFYNQVVK